MSKITKFSPPVCKLLDQRIKDALAPLAAEFGVQIKIGGGSYLGGSYKPKFEVSVVTEGGLAMTPEAEAFKQCAAMLGFKPDDLGRAFVANGMTMKVTGYRPRASARPILATTADGNTYVFPTDAIKRAFAAQDAVTSAVVATPTERVA